MNNAALNLNYQESNQWLTTSSAAYFSEGDFRRKRATQTKLGLRIFEYLRDMRNGYPIASTESGQKGLLWHAEEQRCAIGSMSNKPPLMIFCDKTKTIKINKKYDNQKQRGCGDLQSHAEAETAVKELQQSGFDMNKLSIVGRDYLTEEHVVGYYNAGDRMKFWGKMGSLWGGLLGFFVGSGFFLIPGIGPLLVAGPSSA